MIKQPWEDERLVRYDKKKDAMVRTYPTEASFWSKLRGDLRKAVWNQSPVKIRKLQMERFKIPHPKGGNRADIWAAKCSCCLDTRPMSDIEVDHIIPAGSLSSIEDIGPFVARLAMPSLDQLRLVCKACHKLITLAERKGISLEDALLEQKMIAFGKLKVNERREELARLGVDASKLTGPQMLVERRRLGVVVR